jgi:hypothetical protein
VGQVQSSEHLSPIVRILWKCVLISHVNQILSVIGYIACSRDVLHITGRLEIGWDLQSTKFLWNLNDGRRKAHHDLPFDAVLEQPNTRTARLVTEDNVLFAFTAMVSRRMSIAGKFLVWLLKFLCPTSAVHIPEVGGCESGKGQWLRQGYSP